MTELGIGVRCWTGWVPNDQIAKSLRDRCNPRCRIAVITDGPFNHLFDDSARTKWAIRFESDREECVATEDILYPIDDFNEDLTEKQESKQEEPA